MGNTRKKELIPSRKRRLRSDENYLAVVIVALAFQRDDVFNGGI